VRRSRSCGRLKAVLAALASMCLPLLEWFPTPQIQLRNEQDNAKKEIR
jgi:hypothetical protein